MQFLTSAPYFRVRASADLPLTRLSRTPVRTTLYSRQRLVRCSVDARLPLLADNTMRTLLNIAIYIVLVAAILPWFLLALPVAAVAFVAVYVVFRVGIRRLQRFQLESMAPLLTHVDATVHGLASVHAYERVDNFQARSVNVRPIVENLYHRCQCQS